MRTSRNVRGSITSNGNFAKLYDLTLKILNLTDFPDGTFSQDGNIWLELANVWAKHCEVRSEGIFLEAVHHIMWGIPSYKYDPDYEKIIQLVVEELLKDGDSFAAWDCCPECMSAITLMGDGTTPLSDNCDDYCLSIEHYEYLRAKMLWKIQYSKPKYASESENCKHAILKYESAIKKVIPDASMWNEAYWYNERHIHDALTELYGVDYSDDFVEYGRILLLLMKHDANELIYARAEVWFASNIKRMPMSLAEVIWPEDTEGKIEEMFLLYSSFFPFPSDTKKKKKKKSSAITEI